MEVEGDGSFQIISATMSDKGLATSVMTSGKAPLVPGGRAAAASRLAPEGAQLLAATFEKTRSITDLSVALNYTYQTLMPAARGRVVIDWSRLETEFKQLSAEYARSADRHAEDEVSRRHHLQLADLFVLRTTSCARNTTSSSRSR